MLRFLARLIAVVCGVAFVVCTVPIVFFHAAGTRLTQPQVYRDALANERLYERLPALAADLATHAVDAGARAAASRGGAVDDSLVNLVHQVSVADWEMMFGAVLPPAYVQRQTERALDQFFGWLHSSTADPVVKVLLGELKQRLVAPETEETYVRILQTKPPCTAAQLQSTGGLPVGCCPSPEEMPRVREAFGAMMRTAAGSVPETVDLFEELNRAGGAIRRLAEARPRLAQLEWLAWWCPVVPAALLLLIAVFAVRSFRGWMNWWGIPCLIAGAAGAVLALPAVPAGKWIFAHFVVLNLPAEVPATTLNALAGLVMAVLQAVMNAALHTAGALAIGGLVAVILGAVFNSRPKPAAAPAS